MTLRKTKHKLTANIRSKKLCEECESVFLGTVVQKVCSDECRATKAKKAQQHFKKKNPGKHREYNKNRLLKNPDAWKIAKQRERDSIIAALGGKCIVPGCGVTNPFWLHADYIPTMMGTGYRHPRHAGWVLRNLDKFRLLCANHHYELTLTGVIEGSNITQKNRYRHQKQNN
jgi:hypothetical protein